jgi:predicted SnoaL-like aldol condensation-catalyzing enzyme
MIADTTAQQNKALVLKAFDTLFNKRDYATAETYWSPHYVQHSSHIEPGRKGLFDLVRAAPANMKYEPGPIVAEGDLVIVHGASRTSGNRRTGLQLISFASRTGCWPNTGT